MSQQRCNFFLSSRDIRFLKKITRKRPMGQTRWPSIFSSLDVIWSHKKPTKLKYFLKLRILVFQCPGRTHITNFTRMPHIHGEKRKRRWIPQMIVGSTQVLNMLRDYKQIEELKAHVSLSTAQATSICVMESETFLNNFKSLKILTHMYKEYWGLYERRQWVKKQWWNGWAGS